MCFRIPARLAHTLMFDLDVAVSAVQDEQAALVEQQRADEIESLERQWRT